MNTNGQGFRRHIFYVLVENRSGVLARVASLFSARGFNIESLTVAPTDNPRVSRMTIVCPGDKDPRPVQNCRLIDATRCGLSVEDPTS